LINHGNRIRLLVTSFPAFDLTFHYFSHQRAIVSSERRDENENVFEMCQLLTTYLKKETNFEYQDKCSAFAKTFIANDICLVERVSGTEAHLKGSFAQQLRAHLEQRL
jgi:hypothetical protein